MRIFKSLRTFLLRKYRKKCRNNDVSDALKRCGSASSLLSWPPLPRQCPDQANTDSGAPSGHLRGRRRRGSVESEGVDTQKLTRRSVSLTGTVNSAHVLLSPEITTNHHTRTSVNQESYPDIAVVPRIVSSSPTFELPGSNDKTLQKEPRTIFENPLIDIAGSSSFDGIPPQPIRKRKEGTYRVTVHRRKRHALTHLGDADPKPGTRYAALNDSRSNTASTSSSRGGLEHRNATSPQFSGTSSVGFGFSRNGMAETNVLSAFNDDSAIFDILKLYDDDGLLPNELFSNTPQRVGERKAPRSPDYSNRMPDAAMANPLANSHITELDAPQFTPESPVSARLSDKKYPIAPLCTCSLSGDSSSNMPRSSIPSQPSTSLEANSTSFGTSYSDELTNRLRLSSPTLFDFLFSPESIFFASQAGGNDPNNTLPSNLLPVEPGMDDLKQRTPLSDPSFKLSSAQKSTTLVITQSLLDQTDPHCDAGVNCLDAGELAKNKPSSGDPATHGYPNTVVSKDRVNAHASAISLISLRESTIDYSHESTSSLLYSALSPGQLERLTPLGYLSNWQSNAQSQASSASQSILGHYGVASSDSEEAVVETAIIESIQWMASPATATYTAPTPGLTLSPDPSTSSGLHSPALSLASPIVPVTPDTPCSHYDAGRFDASKLIVRTERPSLHPRSTTDVSSPTQLGDPHDEMVDDAGSFPSSPARRLLASYSSVSGSSHENVDIRRTRGPDARSENRKAFLYGPENNESLDKLRAMLAFEALDDGEGDSIAQFVCQTAWSELDDPFISVPDKSSLVDKERATTALRRSQTYLKHRQPFHCNDTASIQSRQATDSRDLPQSNVAPSRIPRFCGSTKALQPFPGGKERNRRLTGSQGPKKLTVFPRSAEAGDSGFQDWGGSSKDGLQVAKHLVPSIMARQGKALAISSTSRPLGLTDKMRTRVLASDSHNKHH